MRLKSILTALLVTSITTATLLTGSKTHVSASVKAKVATTPLYTFSVISDTHLGSGYTAIKNTSTALNSIKNNFSDRCIVINGDVVDNYLDSSYQDLTNVVNYVNTNTANPSYNPSSISGKTSKLPYIYFNFGNHEFRENATWSSDQSKYDWSLSQFCTYTRSIQTKLTPNGVSYTDRDRDKSYDVQYVNNATLFFLGSDNVNYGDCAYLDPNYQLSYLQTKINNKPLFLFCHQPIYNTVYGSDANNCIYNSSDLTNIIGSHSNAIMFTSHTHNSFTSTSGFSQNFAKVGQSSVFATSSVVEGPQGLHVKVYSDRVVVDAVSYTSGSSYSVIASKTVYL
ncbi:metallophosphoesterase family protein [Clostridium manihotivorum]|uniref:Calcineurin-like phosphoesterase domain-containing protein n=1 Tax=Clostridium manihotivorum TaxID=2320868 RepID=A0A3R5QTS0_9CLOT|nr:metallophosphoesterase [Clostridium manihotivorum]QAA32420.1 hypothetical protein C1I91_12645 [Clostridium manihotivorum]